MHKKRVLLSGALLIATLFCASIWCGNCTSTCVSAQPVISPLIRDIMDNARETGELILTDDCVLMLSEDDWVELFGPDMNPAVTTIDLSDTNFVLLLDSHIEKLCLLVQSFPNLAHIRIKSCNLWLLKDGALTTFLQAFHSIRSLQEIDLSDNGLSIEQGQLILRTLPGMTVYVS